MLMFRNILIVVFVVFGYEMSAFTPKVSYTKEPLPTFNISSGKFSLMSKSNPKDPSVLEMTHISRENIKNLPDELDFGNVSLDDYKKSETIKRYNIYNYIFEGISFSSTLQIFDTMDSISVYPSPDKLGSYSSGIIFNWEEADPITEIVKYYKKTLKIKANIIESVTVSDQVDNQIKEIWYERTDEHDFEDKGLIEGGDFSIGAGGTVILPDSFKIEGK